MKFLCDRCKTRYSIADERVRGKILKIRCKNCSNVISVREGMTDAEPAVAASGSALQDAFASVMSGEQPRAGGDTQPPPPVLEEEWYVAIDGNQSGPFTLAEAQAWVGGQKPSEELYCWCEGFDDWLPVEKVSHFRGLRSPQAPRGPRERSPTASRPVAKESGPSPARREVATEPAAPAPPSPSPSPSEEEPKPLFAATLAKLEAESSKEPLKPAARDKGADGSRPVEKVAKPADKAPARLDKLDKPDKPDKPDKDKSRPAEKAPALSSLGPVQPRAPLPMPSRTSPTPLATPSAPLGRGAQAAVASAASSLQRAEGNAAAALAKPLPEPAKPLPEPVKAVKIEAEKPGKGGSRRPMFDTGEPEDSGEGEALDESALEPADDDAARAAKDRDGTDGLDLDIGEVSRVVRLPDLLAAGAARSTGRAAAQRGVGRSTGSAQAIARGTGAAPAIVAAAGAAALGVAGGANEALPPLSDAVLADAQPQLAPSVEQRPQHGMLWMIGGAVLLVGVIAIIAVAASSSSGDAEQVSGGYHDLSGLGYTYNPMRPQGGTGTDEPDGSGSSSGSVAITGTHIVKHPNGGNQTGTGGNQQLQNGSGTGRQEIGPNGDPILPLTGDDIIQVLHKNQIGYSRCYDRALKKDPMLQVGKIMVSLAVDNNGVVTDVVLDSYAKSDLGECLTAAIRRWSFRKSTEGIKTVIPLVFQQGG